MLYDQLFDKIETETDISYKINPSICSDEIERREKVKLYKGIESGKKIEIENSVNKLKEIKKKYIE